MRDGNRKEKDVRYEIGRGITPMLLFEFGRLFRSSLDTSRVAEVNPARMHIPQRVYSVYLKDKSGSG